MNWLMQLLQAAVESLEKEVRKESKLAVLNLVAQKRKLAVPY